jgi:hypothetical protein
MSMTETQDKTYNGWTNYETWNAALWMDNDEGSYKSARCEAEQALEDADNDKDDAKQALAKTLKGQFEENAPDLGASPYSDLLGAAMSEINWYEIAGNLVDEVYEEPEEDEEEDE